MSESALDDPHPASFEVNRLANIPYGNRNLTPDERQKLAKAVNDLGRSTVKLVVDSYFNMTSLSGSDVSFSHIETHKQSFVGKIESVSFQQEVTFQLEDGTELQEHVIGFEVAGVDRRGAEWQLFATLEDLQGIYPSLNQTETPPPQTPSHHSAH